MPLAVPALYDSLPSLVSMVLSSGVSAAAFSAVLLNLLLKGAQGHAAPWPATSSEESARLRGGAGRAARAAPMEPPLWDHPPSGIASPEPLLPPAFLRGVEGGPCLQEPDLGECSAHAPFELRGNPWTH